jgi:hypothetical protein
MVLVNGSGLPLAVDSACPAEVNLIEPLIDGAITSPIVPWRYVTDTINGQGDLSASVH